MGNGGEIFEKINKKFAKDHLANFQENIIHFGMILQIN